MLGREDPASIGVGGLKGKPPAGKPPANIPGGVQKIDPNQPVKEEKKNFSKEIKSYKTFRQKSAFNIRNTIFKEYKEFFDQRIVNLIEKDKKLVDEELKFEFAWEKNLLSIIGGN